MYDGTQNAQARVTQAEAKLLEWKREKTELDLTAHVCEATLKCKCVVIEFHGGILELQLGANEMVGDLTISLDEGRIGLGTPGEIENQVSWLILARPGGSDSLFCSDFRRAPNLS